MWAVGCELQMYSVLSYSVGLTHVMKLFTEKLKYLWIDVDGYPLNCS